MALNRLSLRDFVIVDRLDLDFESGFSVLSGETGAGKSILIDAIQLVLGQRADAGVVRQGAKRCEISAEFDSPETLSTWLDEQGFSPEQGLLLKRQIDADGRSRGWINGSVATMGQLKTVAEYLIDIHGQHAWHSLTRAAAQLELLDGYARIDLNDLGVAWRTWRQAQQSLDAAKQQAAINRDKRDQLLWQISELDKLKPLANEWASLNEDHARLAHAQDLLEAAQTVVQDLAQEPHDVGRTLYASAQRLNQLASFEPQFLAWSQSLQEAANLINDAAHGLKNYARHGDLEPEQFQSLDERLALWLSLARRFKCEPDALADVYIRWQSDLSELDANADLNALEKRVQQAEQVWRDHAAKITQTRLQAARQLAQEVTAIMQNLGMQGGELLIEVTPGEPHANGLDQIEFLVAGHRGVKAKPVAKVASGGELSRIALAVAVCTSRLGAAATLIFDEVDAGIGGRVAQTVGDLMRQLGADRQVLAITHLAPVAAAAHHHFKVQKLGTPTETLSRIESLDDLTRIEEIARMLGGDSSSPTVMAHAKEMLSK